MTKLEATVKEFQDALERFEDALRQEKTEFIRDSAIKRFELTFDLAWKAIKAALEETGIFCVSPLNCFREAYRQGLIDYERIWVGMVNTRNETVHTYKEALAEKVYGELPQTLAAFSKLLTVLKQTSQ
jgi:nucleotidyltransferase substrate binding protein (TIGR01987 family)